MKDERNEVEIKRRHIKQQELNTELIRKKQDEKQSLIEDLENLN
jgi:hypothetical protein